MKDIYVHPRKTNQGESPGMELFDWFAGMALMGLCSNPEYNKDTVETSILAYGYAKYMMVEREEY